MVEKLFRLILRLNGQVYAKLTEGIGIYLRKNNGRMNLTVTECGESVHSSLCKLALCRGNRKRYKHLVGMKPGVMVAKVLRFESLYRSKYLGRYDVGFAINARKSLECVKESGARSSEKRRGLTRNYSAVVKLYSNRRRTVGFKRFFKRRLYASTLLVGNYAELLHKKLYFMNLNVTAVALSSVAESVVVSADYLTLCGV